MAESCLVQRGPLRTMCCRNSRCCRKLQTFQVSLEIRRPIADGLANSYRQKALQDEPVPVSATSESDLPREKLLPLYSRICDLFQVADIHSADSPSSNEESYIDFAFGSDLSRFSGAHRFSILRDPHDPEKATITYASVVCNPQTGKYVIPPLGEFFHRVYAVLLFKDAMAEVLGDLAQ